MGRGSLRREYYLRLYIAQLHAGSRTPYTHSHVVKWWKQRSPLPIADRTVPGLKESEGWEQRNEVLAEYLSASKFSFDDYKWAQRGIEAPLERLAEALGRVWVRAPPVSVSRKNTARWQRAIVKHSGLLRARGAVAARRRESRLGRVVYDVLRQLLWPLVHRRHTREGESLVLKTTTRELVGDWDLSARCLFTSTSVLEDRSLQKLIVTLQHDGNLLGDCTTAASRLWIDADVGCATAEVCGKSVYLNLVESALQIVTHADGLVRLPESASCYSGLLCIGRNTVSSKRSYLRATDIAMASYDKLKRTHKKMQTALDDLERQMAC